MSESFLHYIWQFQYFSKIKLQTTQGEPIVVFTTGFPNTHAGPDFQNSRLKIDELEWVGSVEIHTSSSAWNEHGHADDNAYENVILHVVWEDDKPVKRKDGSLIPTLELKERVDDKVVMNYNKLVNNPAAIPCSTSLNKVSELVIMSMVDKALVRRLESKSDEVMELVNGNGNDWEETTYQLLAKNFGFKVNGEPFLQLARSVPYKFILKHSDKLEQIEAILLGQAGFLDERIFPDEYAIRLRREYGLLSKKFDLRKYRMDPSQWKFLRMRPANFPGLRIAQFSSLLYHRHNLFSSLAGASDYATLKVLLSIPQSEYWTQHYHFGICAKTNLHLGEDSIENLIINTVVPLLVAWSRFRDETSFMDQALAILQACDAESNKITRRWATFGIQNQTAADSQGLLELYHHFCSTRRCLDCTIGSQLIRPM